MYTAVYCWQGRIYQPYPLLGSLLFCIVLLHKEDCISIKLKNCLTEISLFSYIFKRIARKLVTVNYDMQKSFKSSNFKGRNAETHFVWIKAEICLEFTPGQVLNKILFTLIHPPCEPEPTIESFIIWAKRKRILYVYIVQQQTKIKTRETQ